VSTDELIGLLAAIALLGVLAHRRRLPYPAVLVLGGIALGLIPGVPTVHLPPHLVLYGFIPVLVYAAAFRAANLDLRAHAVQIVSLATGLVLLTVASAGAVAHLVSGIPWAAALVFGALAAPTDPVSATAVIGQVGAPEEIVTVLEGESLVNDGTGLAVFQVAVAAVSGGFSPAHGVVALVEISAGGIAIGLAGGWLLVALRRGLDEPQVEIVLGMLAAFGTYVAAQAAGFSGVLAAVAAGLYTGRHTLQISSARARLQMEPFWDALTFVLQSVLFLLIGLQLVAIVDGLPRGETKTAALTAVAALGVLFALRAAWMLAVAPALSRLTHRGAHPLPRSHAAVLSWSGMRGALSLAGALSIPLSAAGHPFPSRDELIFLVYCAVLGTLIVPSFTLGPLLGWLGLAQGERLRRQERDARVHVAHAALAELERVAGERELSEELLARLRAVYELRLARLEAGGGDGGPRREREADELAMIRHELIAAQRRALGELRAGREVGAEVLARIRHDIDLEETRLRGRS
jgi:Na+/H+ antiporter